MLHTRDKKASGIVGEHAPDPAGAGPVVVNSSLDPRSAPLSGLPQAPRLFQGVGAAYSSLAIRAPGSAAR